MQAAAEASARLQIVYQQNFVSVSLAISISKESAYLSGHFNKQRLGLYVWPLTSKKHIG
jgi:hypothetical protein